MNKIIKQSILAVLLVLLLPLSFFGQLRVPRLISDGMVLQKDADVKIWGWTAPEGKVSVSFLDSVYLGSANSAGEWEVHFHGLKAGGPYAMTIQSGNSVTIKDILIGEVWICSGQSNMELPMRRVSPIYGDEIAGSANPQIRYFAVPQQYNFNHPLNDLTSGVWKPANPENVLNFSAVAYFFAKELYEKYHVPVGLINASLGGSPAEAWLSGESLKSFPDHYRELQRFKDTSLIVQIDNSDRIRIQGWYDRLNRKDEGYKNPVKKWSDPGVDASGWATMRIPGYWDKTPLQGINGAVWFRKVVDIPVAMTGKPAKLILGRIVDADSAFINGIFIGTISYQYPPRRYDIPSGLLKEGKNTVTVRVISNAGNGGFVPDKPYFIVAGEQKINLEGEWQYRAGAVMEPLGSQTFIRWKPGGLFNAMISPLLNYRMKGVIWYQGESNADRPDEYRKLFPALINDWREHWQEGNFPFLFVQLPNFMEKKEQPSESNWALFREVQLKTLALPNTGMAVTYDIGEWNDIHPLNKKDVGRRLALAARKVAYGDNQVVYSGPVCQSMKIAGRRIVLSFTNQGSGLVSKNGKLKYFAIAGDDRQFQWANAKIRKNKVIVRNSQISKPVAVRYAWADNPEGANLYNKEGLPASPFRMEYR